jgi:hypothetical protein
MAAPLIVSVAFWLALATGAILIARDLELPDKLITAWLTAIPGLVVAYLFISNNFGVLRSQGALGWALIALSIVLAGLLYYRLRTPISAGFGAASALGMALLVFAF